MDLYALSLVQRRSRIGSYPQLGVGVRGGGGHYFLYTILIFDWILEKGMKMYPILISSQPYGGGGQNTLCPPTFSLWGHGPTFKGIDSIVYRPIIGLYSGGLGLELLT